MQNIYNSQHLKREHYKVSLDEQKLLLDKLKAQDTIDSKRILHYLSLPDLSRLEGNPVKAITEKVISLPSLINFDVIETPDVISSKIVFDLFNFPPDHPVRSRSDTYYVDNEHILRPHTSMMWKYYFDIPEVKKKLFGYGSVGAISYGTVYRRDEIDWQHTNVLHHIDGLFVCRKDIQEVGQTELEKILWEVAHSLFGKDIVGRFNLEHYPYTDPSLEMEILWEEGKWVEILGAGIVHPQVLRNIGIDPEIYSGWAFGFGAERLAMIKMRIPDIRLFRSSDERVLKQFTDIEKTYQPVSKYPPIRRDISFIVDKSSFNENRYYEAIKEILDEDMVEEVKIIDKFENEEKLGRGKISYTFSVIYRNLNRTLTNEEVDVLHKKLEARTANLFSAKIR